MTEQTPSRRGFLKTGAATLAVLGSAAHVHAAGNDTIRVGLIGCGSPRGGRGRGAAENCVNAGPGVKLVAMADLFKDHLDYTLDYLSKKHGKDKVDVPEGRRFVGWDAYQRLVEDRDVDLVILASPPAFRPAHLEAAVKAGKHVFAEKPVAVDGPGIRQVLKTVEEAKGKNLSIVSGLCWRYDTGMRETFKRVHEGAIGDILTLQSSYITGDLWHVPREEGWSDVEWHCRNWLYFTWLSGDFNVEQHVHSLDKMAWVMKDEYPVKAVGLGGRQVRTQPEFGHVFDHHSVVYEYKNGVKCFSACRQQPGKIKHDVSDHIWGTKGVCHIETSRHEKGGFKIKPHDGKSWAYYPASGVTDPGMYQNEHNELIASIRSGKPINNGDYMTKSSLMAIMGRMATYTGQEISWEMAL
ncbi:MAG TPA: Gfo/Idh/MocA family oxidoreductase, partial [Gemmataceae bacterium]|nr:Gfo/Idh/MocA family oxidoreductase [Gemmataceae bacterium]